MEIAAGVPDTADHSQDRFGGSTTLAVRLYFRCVEFTWGFHIAKRVARDSIGRQWPRGVRVVRDLICLEPLIPGRLANLFRGDLDVPDSRRLFRPSFHTWCGARRPPRV